MLRVNGFYGHVRRNDLRSLAMFAGFAVSFQILAAVALFLPLLVLDLRHAPFLTFGYVERYVPVVLVLGVVLFAVRFLRHVRTVQATVDFAYVDRRTDPRLVNIVETTAIAAGLPPPKVGLIESEARNAFACGLSASSAVVVVTRGLLQALDDAELAAVVAHEIAHIRNGDIRLMAAANVLMENLALVQRRNLLRGVGWKTAVLVVFVPALLIVFVAAGFVTRVAFTVARVARLLIASSREFVADAEAVRLTHDPAALISALRRIEGRSAFAGLSPQTDAMMIDGAVDGPTATHPTVGERIAVLRRLSGALAEPGPRRDARPVAPPDPGSGSGRPAPAAAAPSRTLVGRVNAGVEHRVVTPGAKRVLYVGFALMVGATFYTIGQFGRKLERSHDGRFAEVVSTLGEPKAPKDAGKDADRLARGAGRFAEAKRPSALDPREARCFATDPYRVGDRGLHRLDTPDPRLVEVYAHGGAGEPSGIVLEKYLGWKERSVRTVSRASGADLDAELLAYVKTRKVVLETVHRFFGEAGLGYLRASYDGAEDRAILDTLRRRLDERAPALVADGRTAAEIELLVSAPGSFVPCLAQRAGQEGSGLNRTPR